jgi:hypothetical protein
LRLGGFARDFEVVFARLPTINGDFSLKKLAHVQQLLTSAYHELNWSPIGNRQKMTFRRLDR